MKKLALFSFVLALAPLAAQAEPQIRPLALQDAADYLKQARYPHASSVIEAGGVDPLLDARLPTRQSRLGPNGAGPRLTVWNSTMNALPGDTVTLYASLTQVQKPGRSLIEALPAAGTSVAGGKISGELIGETLGSLGTVTYLDNGIAPDAVAGDGIYAAAFRLGAQKAPALGQADSVMVKVEALLDGGDVRRAAGGLLYSNPAARLTGKFTDSIRNGNLVIAAEMEVLAPGRVHLSGTIADLAGAPVATAQAAKQVQPGKQVLELSFYGLAFHDRGVAGALKLASVALTSTNGMPNALGPVLTGAHVTRAYALTQFTAQPFNRPDLVETARRLQASVPVLDQ